MAPTDFTQELHDKKAFDDNHGYSIEQQSDFALDFDYATLEGIPRTATDADVPTLTKAELTELLLERVGLNKREAKQLVDAFFTEISDALERGEAVKLARFGNFQLRDKVSRPGRNPMTGKAATVPARRVVTFRPSLKLSSRPSSELALQTRTCVNSS